MRSVWSDGERLKLIEAWQRGENWKTVARQLPRRTTEACHAKFYRLGLGPVTTNSPSAVTSEIPQLSSARYSLIDFEILRTLGKGGFGRVHLVQSQRSRRFYALKVLRKAHIVKNNVVENTNNERRLLNDIKHPYLVRLWGTFQDRENLYMVMDFIEGGELFSLMEKFCPFHNSVSRFYVAEVTVALEYLHSKNIIYLDLKPENILIDRTGHVVIVDFGFAKEVHETTKSLCGTLEYAAPELICGKDYDKTIDWWSLDILIYEMLCGYMPFEDASSIIQGKVEYPAFITPEAKSLLGILITADITKRPGGCNNLFDIKTHAWFKGVAWNRLRNTNPPYKPPIRGGVGDASQFDEYLVETEEHVNERDNYEHYFEGF